MRNTKMATLTREIFDKAKLTVRGFTIGLMERSMTENGEEG